MDDICGGDIGRFDILVDTDNNCVSEYTWSTIPIDDAHCPLVLFSDLAECFPYDGPITMIAVTGGQLRRMLAYVY